MVYVLAVKHKVGTTTSGYETENGDGENAVELGAAR
jgi:hypothetical protein